MTGYERYTRTDIQTSDPRAVVVLLYEGAIKFLNQAHDAILSEDRAQVSVFIKKTKKILSFLSGVLDHDQGGEIAENLSNLYRYMADTLSEANLDCDPEKINEVIRLLKPLLDAWREVAEDPEAAKALSQHKAQEQGQSEAIPIITEAIHAETLDTIDGVTVESIDSPDSGLKVASIKPTTTAGLGNRGLAAYGG